MRPTPQRSQRHLLGLAWLVVGCGDEVVGYFDDSGSGSMGEDSSAASSSSGDQIGLVPPGCIVDHFDDTEIDPMLWNTWAEQDASLAEIGGALQFTPPTFGIWDTGVVSSYLAIFPFIDGRARVRVPVPPAPARPVVLFLQVFEEHSILSIQVSAAGVHVYGSVDEQIQYGEDFPADPYPSWIAIRAEGSLAHYEVSNDGIEFTTLTTHDKLGTFDVAQALLMAQTYGDDPDRSVVTVDDFEVCVQ